MESDSLPDNDPGTEPQPEKEPGEPTETGADEVPPSESLEPSGEEGSG